METVFFVMYVSGNSGSSYHVVSEQAVRKALINCSCVWRKFLFMYCCRILLISCKFVRF